MRSGILSPLHGLKLEAQIGMKKVLLIGSGAREQAIARALKESREEVVLSVYASHHNPGFVGLASDLIVGSLSDNQKIVEYACNRNIDFAIVGPEGPLANGIVDDLQLKGIPSVGPTKNLAQLETSKSFTRNLTKEFDISGSVLFQSFESFDGLPEFLKVLENGFVIKPDGLTGGKGVKVMGDHFANEDEGIALVHEIFSEGQSLVIEEKLTGQEFSLMSFCDGEHLVHLPAVQDHKRAFENDKGPNTGGMGTYSMADGSLPFLRKEDIAEARSINEAVALAIRKKTGIPYKGVLYGGFMATKTGVKLIEYNARLGDPEAMNVLSVFPDKSSDKNAGADFLDICEAIIKGTLNTLKTNWKPVCTVCKYAVPNGYPGDSVKGEKIDLSALDQSKAGIFYAAVEAKDGDLILTGSRAVAVIATHEDLYKAEKLVEAEIRKIRGPVFHRSDIGTASLIDNRIKMMEELRNEKI
jgi:fusion protein PurCD